MDELTPTARWTITQPWRGIFGLVVTLGLMMIVTACFDLKTYLGPFTAILMWNVSFIAVIAAGWQGQYPSTEGVPQPWIGFLLTALAILIGAILTTFFFVNFLADGEATPFINIQGVITVIVTFYLVVGFGMWPFSKLSLPAKGFLTLLLAYVVGWLVTMLANFSVMTHAKGFMESPVFTVPFYAKGGPFEAFAGIAPMGPIPWESLVAYIITTIAFFFSFMALQFWPFNKSPRLMKQPVMGIVVVITCAVLGYILYIIGVAGLKIVPIRFMLYVVCFLFGLLMFLNVFQMWPGRTVKSPVGGGFLNIGLSIPIGIIAYYGIRAFCVGIFGAEPLHYPNATFAMANLMLGMTFPAWALYVACWDFWPLPPTPPPPESPGSE